MKENDQTTTVTTATTKQRSWFCIYRIPCHVFIRLFSFTHFFLHTECHRSTPFSSSSSSFCLYLLTGFLLKVKKKTILHMTSCATITKIIRIYTVSRNDCVYNKERPQFIFQSLKIQLRNGEKYKIINILNNAITIKKNSIICFDSNKLLYGIKRLRFFFFFWVDWLKWIQSIKIRIRIINDVVDRFRGL